MNHTSEELIAQLLATIMLLNAQGIYTALFTLCGRHHITIRIYEGSPTKEFPLGKPIHGRLTSLDEEDYTPHRAQKLINMQLTSELKAAQSLLQPATQQQSEQPA